MAEWLKALVSKTSIRATVSRVQIPLFPSSLKNSVSRVASSQSVSLDAVRIESLSGFFKEFRIFKMKLSPVDHLFTGRGAYPINFVFLFRGLVDPSRLESSLAGAVNLFWPLKSTLQSVGKNSLGFDSSKSAHRFQFSKSVSMPSMDNLAALGDFIQSVRSGPGDSLLDVRLTHSDGNSALGVSASHSVVDGYSYFMFLTAWSRLFRVESPDSPALDRSVFIHKTYPGAEKFSSDEIFNRTGFSISSEPRPAEIRIKWKVIDFSKAELDALYKNASSDLKPRLSLNDVLTAELWKRFVLEYQKAGELLTLSCAYDFRRIFPKAGPLYFGNAIRGASFRMNYDEARDLKLGLLAQKISETVKSIDVSAVESSLQCLESLRLSEGLQTMERFHVADPHKGFLVTNLSRLPLLGLDFGSGAPVDFRILTPALRTAVILPHSTGLRVQIALAG